MSANTATAVFSSRAWSAMEAAAASGLFDQRGVLLRHLIHLGDRADRRFDAGLDVQIVGITGTGC